MTSFVNPITYVVICKLACKITPIIPSLSASYFRPIIKLSLKFIYINIFGISRVPHNTISMGESILYVTFIYSPVRISYLSLLLKDLHGSCQCSWIDLDRYLLRLIPLWLLIIILWRG